MDIHPSSSVVNTAENQEKQTAWICRLDQYPQMILNPKLKSYFFLGNNVFTNIVNGLLVLKIVQLSNGDLIFCKMPTEATNSVLNG